MDWKNSKERYGKIAMIIHWSVALLFLLLYVSVYYRQWFTEPRTDINWLALQLHLSFGVTVAVIIGLRIFYKFMDISPDEPAGPWWEHWAARLGHWSLYAVMIVIPLTGYFGTGVNTEFFSLFEIPKFKDTGIYDLVVTGWLGLTWEVFEPPIDFVHKQGGKYIVWVLILGHIGAAMYHHFVKKDDVLMRMLPESVNR